jgi:putative oxidoreductase
MMKKVAAISHKIQKLAVYLEHPFLLLIRLYWGWGFFVAGKGKLMNLQQAVATFEMWEVPMPRINALMAGMTETFFGLALLVGLFSRLSAIPLIFVMVVAYLTAHVEEVESLADFIAAPPFNHMMAAIVVLIFGPGVFSADRLFQRWLLPNSKGNDERKGPAA